MVFSSLPFVCAFLPLVVGLYFALPKAANNLVLVVASYAFYGWGDPVALLLLIPSVAVNFQFGRFIDRAKGAFRHHLVAATVALNLLVLIVFKYSDFILANVNFLLDKVDLWQVPLPHLTLPLGLSFFTFHIISYLVDVYRGNQRAQQSPLAFALYIVNFPQLIAGPIIRYSQIADQLVKRRATLDDIDAGIIRFSTGLAKKLFIANPIGVVVDQIFALPSSNLSVPALWLGAVSYALQIYFDFSGYSDMAIGIGRIFGFRFPENFNYPYSAISIQDFWRRWHMTLSAWFRDYVYIPLGGNQFGPWKTARNLWLVFLLCGAWHGASWTFILWGMWHGLFLWFERLKVVNHVLLRCPRVFRTAYAALIVLVGWVLFRADSLQHALAYLGRMFGIVGPGSQLLPLTQFTSTPMLILIVAASFLSFPLWPVLKLVWPDITDRRSRLAVGDVLSAGYVGTVMILSLATMAANQQNPFLYFRF
jgi:alginate O-acetyltransferase complex protein AlgI